MKFLLECVGCCTTTTTNSGEEPTSPATPRTEETRSLVQPPISRRRIRRSSSSRPAPADWRPSLFAISEDNPVGLEKAGNQNRNRTDKVAVVKTTTTGSRNVVKRCATSSVRVNAHPHSRSHDFGHNPLPMVVPAFSAAPFMF